MFTDIVLSSFWRSRTRGIGFLLVITLLAALLPTSFSAAATNDCDYSFEVKRGDTLKSIGSTYGWAANQIVYANNLKSPYTIYIGQRLCLPTKTVSGLSNLASKYANALAVYFSAARAADDSNLLVYTYNYPKTKVTVEVDNATDSVRKFVNVGVIDVARVGNGHAWRFKLPTDLKNARQIYICMKDNTTNYQQCVYPRTGP